MKRNLLLSCLLLSVSASFAQQKQVPRPKLVVGIVVDQMRWDYLYRYYDRYTDGGFKRLLNEGFECRNTMISYLPSFTAPGHTCIYTGSVPSIHGIAANDWLDNKTGRHWYCTEDTAVDPVGGSRVAGMMSPRNMLTSTITDELKLATNMRSKTFGICIKDRGSILPAGHLANGAFWFDDSTGNFITSTFYGDELPEWMNNFNDRRWADSLLQNWELLYDESYYRHSIEDNNNYEGTFTGEKTPTFPHKVNKDQLKGYLRLRYLPGGNTLVFKAARACINGEDLGQGRETDFLALSFSSTDYTGHQYAPNALEMEDIYIRFDRELASFLRYLDNHIGEGNYTVFLSADHGGAHNAEYLKDLDMPAGIEYETKMTTELNKQLKAQFGRDSLIKEVNNYQVFLNENRIAAHKLDRQELKEAIISKLLARDNMAYAVDMEEIDDAVVPQPIRDMIINGYYRQRSGVIQFVLKPGWYAGYNPKGTTHGSWNPYDTHIPLIWYGWGIRHGYTTRTVHMTDISATLAALLRIQMPNGCIGEPITEVTDR